MSKISLVFLVVLAVLWLAGGSGGRALPPEVVHLQAGPVGGSYDEHAQVYARALQAAGLKTELSHIANSTQIVSAVNDHQARPRVDIGFTAQALSAKDLPNVFSVGVIELQPLFLFHRSSLGVLSTPEALRGKRLVMPPAGSATSQAALDVLAQYGITPDNTPISFVPIAQAATALQRAEFDAGFFMLAPSNAMITTLATDDGLGLFSFSENVAITRHVDYLKPTTLARGAFDLRKVRPAQDVQLVGAAVNVVVRGDIHPAVLYALLGAMQNVHKGQSLVSNHGDYPSLVGTGLPVHPLASEWAKSGTPWLYTHLRPSVVGLVDAYWGPALFLLAVVSAFSTLGSLNDFIHGMALAAALLFLALLQWRVQAGRVPGAASRGLFRLAERVVLQEDSTSQARGRLERLRPHLAPPSHG
jgi:TRAP-type uncharacterized transport system substrate-binding protein